MLQSGMRAPMGVKVKGPDLETIERIGTWLRQIVPEARILIAHGNRDDNVHVQNTLQLVQALQRANKQFELMIYPPNRHGIGGAHYRKLRTDFIRKTMLGK